MGAEEPGFEALPPCDLETVISLSGPWWLEEGQEDWAPPLQPQSMIRESLGEHTLSSYTPEGGGP